MCHHWAGDRDATWERVSGELPEDDPETQEPEREHDELVERPATRT